MNNIPEIDLPVYEKISRRIRALPDGTYEVEEILLSDVLNFLDEKDDEESGYQFTTIVGMWNYPFPYYSQQSEETKAFIRSLI